MAEASESGAAQDTKALEAEIAALKSKIATLEAKASEEPKRESPKAGAEPVIGTMSESTGASLVEHIRRLSAQLEGKKEKLAEAKEGSGGLRMLPWER